MSITTIDNELEVIADPEPSVHRTTMWRRRKRLVELAWEEFADGDLRTTPDAALRTALNRYRPDTSDAGSSPAPSAAGRSSLTAPDAVTCSGVCRSGRH